MSDSTKPKGYLEFRSNIPEAQLEKFREAFFDNYKERRRTYDPEKLEGEFKLIVEKMGEWLASETVSPWKIVDALTIATKIAGVEVKDTKETKITCEEHGVLDPHDERCEACDEKYDDEKNPREIVRDVEFFYPRNSGEVNHIEIGLSCVRAADNIRLSYDYERDGYKIEQPIAVEISGKRGDNGVCYGRQEIKWKETAFLESWALEDEYEEVELDQEDPYSWEWDKNKTYPRKKKDK